MSTYPMGSPISPLHPLLNNTEECSTCKYWDSIVPNPLDEKGICRRYPPVYVPGESEAMQPITLSYDYCGEYWSKEHYETASRT